MTHLEKLLESTLIQNRGGWELISHNQAASKDHDRKQVTRTNTGIRRLPPPYFIEYLSVYILKSEMSDSQLCCPNTPL